MRLAVKALPSRNSSRHRPLDRHDADTARIFLPLLNALTAKEGCGYTNTAQTSPYEEWGPMISCHF